MTQIQSYILPCHWPPRRYPVAGATTIYQDFHVLLMECSLHEARISCIRHLLQLESQTRIQTLEGSMFNSFRLFVRLQAQGPQIIKRAIHRPGDLSRSNPGYKQPHRSPQPERLDRQRLPNAVGFSSPKLLSVALASVILGFGLANFSLFPSNVDGVGVLPKFGSPEDVEKAIQELRTALVAEARVSTDPGDLHIHGFSPNDHHPGPLSPPPRWRF